MTALKAKSMQWRAALFVLFSSVLPPGVALAAGNAGYFGAAAPTPYWTDYLGDFRIEGLAAEPGDEIAFFDPQGVLCGVYVVPEGSAGQYGIVHVYGDDPATTVDEGASPGEVLTLRVWDSSAGREYSHAELDLSVATIGSYPPSSLPPVWQDQAGYVLNVDTVAGRHFPEPVATPYVANYIGALIVRGLPAEVGDEVAVFDPAGVLTGWARVSEPGQYGVVQVYGDDPDTATDEGAEEGDALTFRVWDRSLAQEYDTTQLSLTAGTPLGSFTASSVPPAWTRDGAYVLDLAVNATLDVDDNGVADAATDGILILRYLFGFRGDALIADAVASDAGKKTSTELEAGLALLENNGLDADGDGRLDALTDGLLIQLFLTNELASVPLDEYLGDDATRTTRTDIENHLNRYLP